MLIPRLVLSIGLFKDGAVDFFEISSRILDKNEFDSRIK